MRAVLSQRHRKESPSGTDLAVDSINGECYPPRKATKHMRPSYRRAVLCVLCFTLFLAPLVWPQVRSATPLSAADSPAPPPYDRLELLASAAAMFDTPYFVAKIRERRIAFIPTRLFSRRSDIALHAPKYGKRCSKLSHTLLWPSNFRPSEGIPDPRRSCAGYRGDPSSDEKYQAALALAPDSPALHLAYAGYLLSIKHYSAAELQARQASELWSGDARRLTSSSLSHCPESSATTKRFQRIEKHCGYTQGTRRRSLHSDWR